jgi:hypothetical protein
MQASGRSSRGSGLAGPKKRAEIAASCSTRTAGTSASPAHATPAHRERPSGVPRSRAAGDRCMGGHEQGTQTLTEPIGRASTSRYPPAGKWSTRSRRYTATPCAPRRGRDLPLRRRIPGWVSGSRLYRRPPGQLIARVVAMTQSGDVGYIAIQDGHGVDSNNC